MRAIWKNLYSWSAAVFCLAFFPAALFAQLYPVEFFKDTLDNGMNVIYQPDKSAPVATVLIQYKVGSLDEQDFQSGFTHLMEHLMMREPTENVPAGKALQYLSEAGGYRQAYTYFNETVFWSKVPAHEIKTPIWLESERMRNLTISEEGVEKNRNIILEEMKFEVENRPYEDYFVKMCEIIFDAWPVEGYAENLNAATKKDLEDFYYTYYQPNNATLVISGDFKLYTIKEFVKNYFGRFKRYDAILRYKYELPKIKENYRKVMTDKKAKHPALFLMYRGPVFDEKAYYALTLLTNILTEGVNSRLYKKLAVQEKEAAEVDMKLFSLLNYGGILFSAVAAPKGDIENIEDILADEINKVCDKGVSDEELQKAKNKVESDIVFKRTDILNKAKLLAKYNSWFGKPEMINTELDSYLKVTKEDIKNAAVKYLDTDRKATIIYMPEGGNK